jgi:hypothetical protein
MNNSEHSSQREKLHINTAPGLTEIISFIGTEIGRGGGMVAPSLQKSVKEFLETYIGVDGKLPTVIHKITVFLVLNLTLMP